jgi:hypothetical protein
MRASRCDCSLTVARVMKRENFAAPPTQPTNPELSNAAAASHKVGRENPNAAAVPLTVSPSTRTLRHLVFDLDQIPRVREP